MRANVLFSAPGAYKGQCIFSFHKTEKNKSLNYWKIGVKIKNYIVPKNLLSYQPNSANCLRKYMQPERKD